MNAAPSATPAPAGQAATRRNSPRVALVVGASSDIGLATCRLLLADGWRVIAHHRRARPELAALAAAHPADLAMAAADFGDPAALEAFIADRQATLAQVDALVNLAAELRPAGFADAGAAELLRALTVNLLPGALLTKAVVPGMLARGWGRIVHASSIGVAYGGGERSYPYALSKHALEFIPAEHRRWAAANVFVNILRIGVVDTRIHAADPTKNMAERAARIPAGRMAAPEEIAEAILWLAGPRNSFTTGQVVSVAGGE